MTSKLSGAPRVALTLVVRDEIDIIAANLDYHRACGVERIVVTDHGSTDGTAEVLREYERSGQVEVIHEVGRAFDQGGWVTRMAGDLASRRAADWVFHLDADEFLIGPTANISDALTDMAPGVKVLSVPRRNFVLRESEDGPFFERMTVRDVGEVRQSGQVSSPKVGHRVMGGVTITDGNHAVLGRRGGEPRPFEGAVILHYPLRSREQMLAKIGKVAGGLTALDRPLGKIGLHVREWQARVQAGEGDALYREWLYSDAEVDEGLASGALVVDTRVRDALRMRTNAER